MPNWKKVVVSGSDALISHLTASGGITAKNISASGDVEALTFTSPALDVTAGSAQMTANIPLTFGALVSGNTGRLNIKHDDSDGTIVNNTGLLTIGNTGAGGIKLGQSATQHTTASGDISASGDLYGEQIYAVNAFRLHDAGGTSRHVVTNGSDDLTVAIGNSNFSSGVLITDAHLTASGNISASGNITANSIIADNTDDEAIIKLLDADGNGIACLARIGSSANAHIGRMVLRDNANVKVDIRATGNSYINGTSAKLGIGTDSPGEALTVNGNISASGAQTQVEAISGSFSVLTGDTSVGTSLEVGGPITGSAFQGTKHILRSMAFYVNDNPMVQNSVYLGNSIGNSPNNWNDPQAVGGAITSNNLTIAEDDMNWGYILPFDISKIEVQCSLRPALGEGDDFTVVIYTGTRSNNSNTNLTLTKVANSSGVVFGTSQRYVTNDITYTADLDKGTLIYVGVGSEDATAAKNARGFMNITVIAK